MQKSKNIHKIILLTLFSCFVLGATQVVYSFSYQKKQVIKENIKEMKTKEIVIKKEDSPVQKSLFDLFSPINENHTPFREGEFLSLEKFQENLMINSFYNHDKLLEIKSVRELNQIGFASFFEQAMKNEEKNQVQEMKNNTIAKYEIFNHPVVIMSLFQEKNTDMVCYMNALEMYVVKGFPINVISYCFLRGEFIGGIMYYPSDYKEVMETEMIKLSPYLIVEKTQDFGHVTRLYYIHSSSRFIVDAYMKNLTIEEVK